MHRSTSIIIATFNAHPYLERCLASLREQLGPADEVIAVDNASTDGTAALIEAYFPEVRVVRSAANHGFAAACNQGAEMASGRVLVFLNQDTRVAPGWLRALVAALDRSQAVGLTTSKALLMSQPERIHLGGQDVHYTGLVSGRGFGLAASSLAASETVAAVAGCSFAIRRELWEELGGFDDMFFMYYEETDLSWRAQLAGYRCLYVPGSVLEHDWGAARPSPLRLYYSFRNRYLMLLKSWRWGTLVVLLPALVLAEIIDWALALAHGRKAVAAKVRANLWLLAHVPEIVRLHRRTQAVRRVGDAGILEHRAWRLSPRRVTGGPAGRVAVAACNLLFLVNHLAAHQLCRLLGW